jgi:hypothetical protein
MPRQNGSSNKSDRSDPKNNKSLAIRIVLKKQPRAKASAVVEAVKKAYGHDVSQNMVYMVKTKANMAADRRALKQQSANSRSPMTTAALWVDAIKAARRLLKATGSVANATALLKAVDS